MSAFTNNVADLRHSSEYLSINNRLDTSYFLSVFLDKSTLRIRPS